MKKFHLAPLALAIVGALAILPSAQSAVAEFPEAGDLDIYSSGKAGGDPTILLMVEGSTFTNYADGTKEHWADLEIIDVLPQYTGNPTYKRYGYYNSISNPFGLKEKVQFPTRLTRMKDAIYYLMDTEGALPDSYKIGLGSYSAGSLSRSNIGDSQTGGIYVPANPLGPIPADKGKYLTEQTVAEYKANPNMTLTYKLDSSGNKIESHRYKIKEFVANMCKNDRFCTGNAPMASAYAEAGAYMLGTKTSSLRRHNKEQDKVNEDNLVWPRVLRVSNNNWQYCPPENRIIVPYLDGTIQRFREECPDMITNADGTKSSGWLNINKDNIPPHDWAENWIGIDKPTEDKIAAMQAKYAYYWTDLLWYKSISRSNPFGSKDSSKGLSPDSLVEKTYNFNEDKFQKRNPTINADGEATDAGATDSYTYYVDDTAVPESGLYPIIRYRAFRVKGIGKNNTWQFCDFDKAKLYDYIYSSYRLMCDEPDWKPINKDNASSFKVDGKAVEWNCVGTNCWLTNRPHGISGWHPFINPRHYYLYDPILNPYDGWRYYYDVYYKAGGDRSYPDLPPTLNIGFMSSGVRNSPPSVRGDKSYTYKAPNYAECSGGLYTDPNTNEQVYTESSVANSIIFITAGWPFSAIPKPLNEMNMSLSAPDAASIRPVDALGKTISGIACDGAVLTSQVASGNALDGTHIVGNNPLNNSWGCMGEYAKHLKDPRLNPAGISVKTGVLMFAHNTEIMPIVGRDEKGVPKYDCDKASTLSQKNACLLGSEKFGGGGYFQSTAADPEQSYKDLANALVDMTKKTDSLGMIPTDLPVVPQDNFDNDSVHDYGYLPLVAPLPGSNVSQWRGNLRKYKQVNGTYIDQDNNSPYADTAKDILASSSRDYWASSSYQSDKQEGGAFENIPMPASDTPDTPRNVYISQATAGELTKLSPDADKIKQVSVTGVSNQDLLRRLLLNYMGYTISDFTAATKTADITKTFSSGANKSLGGVFHSTPILLTARLDLDNTTKQYVPKNQYILFGSMDNALHIVDDKTGEEVMSYFPREVLANNGQYKAITPELSAATGEAKPSFGVDGPWTSYASYDKPAGKDFEDYHALIAKELYAYGGARLGAKAYYGLDLSEIQRSSFKPDQLFTITPDTTVKVNGTANKKPFKRLGYSWGKPVVTKIRWQGKPRLVVILTGGYDLDYDKTDDKRTPQDTFGNAVYIVDAKTGEPLIVTSNTTDNLDMPVVSNKDNALVNDPNAASSKYNGDKSTIPVFNSNLKYSIPGSVKILDRDADELTDHVYFADLNGQVFRMDIDNSVSKLATKDKNDGTNPSVRVVRLAELAPAPTPDGEVVGPRLYEAPTVTIHENDGGDRFAVVSVASGDRSNPLWTPTNNDIKHNRVYAIYDKDVAKTNLFRLAPDALTTKDVKASELINKPTSLTDSNFTKKGWSFPLDKAGAQDTTTEKSNAIKAMGPLSAVDNKLYVAAYNPNDGRSDPSSCSAEVKGTSEALQFCLPYGYCSGNSGQYQRIKIGNGVLGIAFGGTGDDNKGRVLLTSNAATTTKDKDGNVVVTPPTNPNLNGSGPAFKQSYQFKPTLRPMGWYDLQSQRYGTTTEPQ